MTVSNFDNDLCLIVDFNGSPMIGRAIVKSTADKNANGSNGTKDTFQEGELSRLRKSNARSPWCIGMENIFYGQMYFSFDIPMSPSRCID